MKPFDEKRMKTLLIYVLITVPIMMTCLLLLLSKQVAISWYGIAVDSAEHLYIGTNGRIQVFSADELLHTFSAPGNAGCGFEMQADNSVRISLKDTIYKLNASGNVTSEEKHAQLQEIEKIPKMKSSYTTDDGCVYSIKNIFGRLVVVRNGNETIYKMPIADYIVKLVLISCIISLFIFVTCFVITTRRVRR